MRLDVIKCQQRSRLNEQGNERNEWECFTPKSLINLASHQTLSSVTPSSPCIADLLRVDRPGQFIEWPCVPGAITPASCPKALSCICVLYLCVCHTPISTVLLLTYSPCFPSSSSSSSTSTPFLFLTPYLVFSSLRHLRPHTVNASSLSALPGSLICTNIHAWTDSLVRLKWGGSLHT